MWTHDFWMIDFWSDSYWEPAAAIEPPAVQSTRRNDLIVAMGAMMTR
ncbi:MAG: hypothetical protein ACK5W0_04795 [Labrys sp. (in: a-proteobacteria)]